MPVVATRGTVYPNAPEGAHAAVCCDIIDLGVLSITYAGVTKKQHKIWIVWQLEELRDDGKPHTVRKRYTLSLHEKSALRKDLESWRGRKFSEEELNGFDVELLLSAPVYLNVIHAEKEGMTYANVASMMRLPKGMQAPTIRDYVRQCDRKDEKGNPQAPSTNWDEGINEGITDDDVPF
jgi:hypothetical protein